MSKEINVDKLRKSTWSYITKAILLQALQPAENNLLVPIEDFEFLDLSTSLESLYITTADKYLIIAKAEEHLSLPSVDEDDIVKARTCRDLIKAACKAIDKHYGVKDEEEEGPVPIITLRPRAASSETEQPEATVAEEEISEEVCEEVEETINETEESEEVLEEEQEEVIEDTASESEIVRTWNDLCESEKELVKEMTKGELDSFNSELSDAVKDTMKRLIDEDSCCSKCHKQDTCNKTDASKEDV